MGGKASADPLGRRQPLGLQLCAMRVWTFPVLPPRGCREPSPFPRYFSYLLTVHGVQMAGRPQRDLQK